jgi:predicted transcriptional regulator
MRPLPRIVCDAARSQIGFLFSKKSFAEWIGVTQQAVSGYIKNEQILPRSIEGEGRHAKIVVNSAVADLRARLDVEMAQTTNRRANLRFYRRSAIG